MDAVTLALIKYLSGNGGSGSLPAVTSSDNGKVLAVKDGAWAADSNLFIVTMPTYNSADKTYEETVAAIEAGKTVFVLYSGKYYTLLEKTSTSLRFIGGSVAPSPSTFGAFIYITFSSTSIIVSGKFNLLNNPVAADNGSELIVKNGSWAMQQKKFIVTLTPTAADFSGTMDETVAEIYAAYEAGQEIWFKVLTGQDTYTIVPLSNVDKHSQEYPSFATYVIDAMNGILIVAWTSYTDDGTKQTYSTSVYTLTPAS